MPRGSLSPAKIEDYVLTSSRNGGQPESYLVSPAGTVVGWNCCGLELLWAGTVVGWNCCGQVIPIRACSERFVSKEEVRGFG
ncbi:MAG TPA: hypothetical protein VNA15_02000 [Candidatus Angelobacter sp.]|nr:hypothetical protein [Candidatus Angelobacter sp.]